MKLLKSDIRDIDKGRVFRLLGDRSGKVPRRAASKVEKSVRDVLRLARPKVLYTTKKVKAAEAGTVVLEDGTALKSAKLSRTLKKCDRVAVFLATIGGGVDRVVKELARGNKISEAYIYDVIGSVAVEEAVDNFQKRFDAALSDSRKSTTLRFSPGYCDWNIREQKKIFEVLDSDAAGVSLTEDCLMSPRKSVSGVFGIAPGTRKAQVNPCTMCSKESCIARR
jgi:hypothetical protein